MGTLPTNSGPLIRVTDHLVVFQGAINVGIIKGNGSLMLIDFGPGDLLANASGLNLEDMVLVNFTHHHRDQACGAHDLAGQVEIGAPKAERHLFEEIDSYWKDPDHRWHLYNFHPHHFSLAEPLRVDRAYEEGDVMEWGPASITAVSTPGHTDGSLSYIVDVDGQRTAFCGDLIYGDGLIWEIYSLQKGNGVTDYHGFMGSRDELIRSLRRIRDLRPTRLIPSHGQIMENPGQAIDKLVGRLGSCHDRYASVSSLRFYFPQMFEKYLKGGEVMPMGKVRPLPSCLRHLGTTWLLISKEGTGFAMDCGATSVIEGIRDLQREKALGDIEGLWITHYHDDHVDAAPDFREEFGCPIIAEDHVADVIENPLAWRIPCISPVEVRVDRRTRDGETWSWREFKMTSFHLPGQTLYTGGLLVEGSGLRMLFSGDSFTPGGIDDHCCGNRNFLGEGLGYDRCVGLLRRLEPAMVFNSHVDGPFAFDDAQLSFIEENLKARQVEMGEMTAWDDPNYGMDEHWVRCFPYEQRARRGDVVRIDVFVRNHSDEERQVECRAIPPHAWKAGRPNSLMEIVKPGDETPIHLSLEIPSNTDPGRYVVPIDIGYGSMFLPQWTEALIDIER